MAQMQYRQRRPYGLLYHLGLTQNPIILDGGLMFLKSSFSSFANGGFWVSFILKKQVIIQAGQEYIVIKTPVL